MILKAEISISGSNEQYLVQSCSKQESPDGPETFLNLPGSRTRPVSLLFISDTCEGTHLAVVASQDNMIFFNLFNNPADSTKLHAALPSPIQAVSTRGKLVVCIICFIAKAWNHLQTQALEGRQGKLWQGKINPPVTSLDPLHFALLTTPMRSAQADKISKVVHEMATAMETPL